MACGPGKLGDWLVPDSICGMYIGDICRWHDAAYTHPAGQSKKQIDRLFYVKLIARAGSTRWKRCVARVYYYAVTRGHLSWWRCRLRERI